MSEPYFLFLDEGGNLDFNPSGSKYFTLTCLATTDPVGVSDSLDRYRYQCLAAKYLDNDHFHCSHDNRYVRREVFEIIRQHQDCFRYDGLIVEKRKTHPNVQSVDRFYPKMLGYLLKYVLRGIRDASEFIIITDTLPVKSKRRAIEKTIRQTLKQMLPTNVQFRIYHHPSGSHSCLQIADYVNWAVFRKWEQGDVEFYNFILPRLRSEFDIYALGEEKFY